MLYFGYLITFLTWFIWIFYLTKVKSQQKGFNNFLILSSFLLGFYSISFGLIGIQISFYKVLPAFIALTYLIGTKFRLPNSILHIFIYFLGISIIGYVIALFTGRFEYIVELGRNPLSTYLNPLVQAALFLSSISQIWLISKNSRINNIKILSAFSYGTLILVCIGYLQIICYKFGLPWFKFWFLTDAIGRGVDNLGLELASDRGNFRMSSLGGEPRHFASILSLSISNILYLRSTKKYLAWISGSKGIFSILFLISGIFATLSASGLLALFLSITVYFFLTNKSKFFILISIYGIMYLIVMNQLSFLQDMFWKLGNIKLILYAAPKDAFALYAIFDNLFSFLFGYGISLADLYKPEYYMRQESPFGTIEKSMESLVVPTSPILQIIINGGIIGFIFLIAKLKIFMKFINNNTKIYFLCIASMCLVSSSLIFGIGLFLISIAYNYDIKQYNNSIKIIN